MKKDISIEKIIDYIQLYGFKSDNKNKIEEYNLKYDNIEDYVVALDMVNYIEEILHKKNLQFCVDFKRNFYHKLSKYECDRLQLNNDCLEYALSEEKCQLKK